MSFQTNTLQNARLLDQNDPLKEFRSSFKISDPSLIYLDGNSLGRLPYESVGLIKEATSGAWGDRLIRGWNEGWWEMPLKLGEKLANLIGAQPEEVLVCDSTSINLFKLVWAALSFKSDRTEIISDQLNFPSDLYIMQGIIDQHPGDFTMTMLESQDGITITEEEIKKTLSPKTALVCLSLVSFKSAFLYDMERITKLCHTKGALVLWDLSHAAGAVPVDLNKYNVDMAVGCSYKYLNGGPGSPAYLYVRRDLQDQLESPLWGWLGDSEPFDFKTKYRPSAGIRKFLVGTPPILSTIPIEVGVDLLLDAGMNRIREKSIAQTEFLITLTKEMLEPLGFSIGTPLNPDLRGSHVALKHAEGYRICKALIDPNQGDHTILPDFREPDNIRIGIAPLYNTFEELYLAVNELKRIVKEKLYEKYPMEREMVT